jgi:hypothetical protein
VGVAVPCFPGTSRPPAVVLSVLSLPFKGSEEAVFATFDFPKAKPAIVPFDRLLLSGFFCIAVLAGACSVPLPAAWSTIISLVQ